MKNIRAVISQKFYTYRTLQKYVTKSRTAFFCTKHNDKVGEYDDNYKKHYIYRLLQKKHATKLCLKNFIIFHFY